MKKKYLLSAVLALCLLCGCAAPAGSPAADAAPAEAPAEANTSAADTASAPQCVGHMALQYAEQFSVDYYDDGSALITVAGTDRYLLLPEELPEAAAPFGAVTVIRKPIRNLYLAASSAMDHVLQLGALDSVSFTSTTAENWGLPEVREALEGGGMRYVGKYSAPDFELLLREDCSLAVESTMIYHSPDIKEMLEGLGIPVLVERSSYETHPLGRVEWIRLYGLLLDREAEAEAFFSEQVQLLDALEALPAASPQVAFFHINTAGAAVIRRPGDYVTKLIELAGGQYVFSLSDNTDESALSTMNMQMEAFYAQARDADVLIYNSAIDGELDSLEQLLEKSPLLADFKAVQTGNVWCTEHDMFQKSTAAAGMIRDFNAVFSGAAAETDTLTFLHRLTHTRG